MTLKIVAVISLVSTLGCGSSASTEQGFPPRDGGTDGADSGSAASDASSEAAGPKVLCCVVQSNGNVSKCDGLMQPFRCWNTPQPGQGDCTANCYVGYSCGFTGDNGAGVVQECNQ